MAIYRDNNDLFESSTGKTVVERDEVLKRMLKMKPKPHKPARLSKIKNKVGTDTNLNKS